MKEEKYTCDICHEEHDLSELTYFDESYLCEVCLRRETFICRDCGDRHWNDDSADGDLCQTCYDEDYVRCERCDAVIHYDDACYHEDEEYHDHPYCRDCFDMDEIIHDYYYKPEPIFYGDGPRYLGVELELDDGGENEFCASKLLDIANAQKEHRDASQALRLESVLYCLFETTYDMEFILGIYLTIKKLFYFLCYRQSIQINSIDLFRQDDKGRYLSAGELFILFGNEAIEDSKIIDKTIQYRLVQNHFEDLIKLITDEKIYLEHIPIDYEASKHISNASFIMDTAAFEWTFKQCYGKIPMTDYKNKIKNDVLNTLENLRTNNEYNSREKKVIKFYKNIIDRVEMKLAGKILYALKDLNGVLMEFIKWIYALNNMSLNEKKVYNEIAEDLEYQRNAYAHGNIDREMKPNIITDTVILEWLNYCMVLKMAGFNETEIFNIINVVFQRNHEERKCDI